MLQRRDRQVSIEDFAIRFESRPIHDPEGWTYAIGRIIVGDFHEPFEAILDYWDREAYATQWRSAARLLANGSERALFLTSYRGPGAAYHFGWPAWRQADRVILRNWFIRTEQLESSFNPDRAHDIVGALQLDADDQPPSEWSTTLAAITEFAHEVPVFPA